jgi:long-chain acyl-CoA synthetase
MNIYKGKTYYESREFNSIAELFYQSVDLFSDYPAVRFRVKPDAEPESRTYAMMKSDVDRLKQGLFARGRTKARIAVVGENSYEWMLVYLAAMTGDSVIVPLDKLLKIDEIVPLLVRADVDTLFYDTVFHDDLVERLAKLERLDLFVPMQAMRDSAARRERVENVIAKGGVGKKSFVSFDALLSAGTDVIDRGEAIEIELPDINSSQALLFTSGTTAMSKGVMLSQRSLAADVKALAGVVKFPAGFRTLSILPLHHTFENTCGFLTVLFFGGCIHIADGLRYIQKNLLEYQVDMVIGVPVLFESFYRKIQLWLEKEGKTKLVRFLRPIVRTLRMVGIDLRRKVFGKILASLGGRLRTCISGAAALDPEIIRFFDDVGVRILQGYGLTETSPVAAGCNDFIFKIGTVGQPLAGIEMAIDSEKEDEPGEILIRGPIVMNGYYRDEEATREAIDEDGWFHTGDLGVWTREGMLTITGRLKSMIVLNSGKKVFPEEIEALLNQMSFVKDSLVYGQEDGSGDLLVAAKLVLDEEKLQNEEGGLASVGEKLEQLIADINQSLPSFKKIKSYFYSFRDMVKTTTQKVKRNVEIKSIDDLMKVSRLCWRELTGKNIDELAEAKKAQGVSPER